MPGLNRTGPMGAGPMTGGGRGLCNPATAANARVSGVYGYGGGPGLGLRRGFRGGFGRGAGMGRGYGRGYGWYPTATAPAFPYPAADEMEMLRAEAEYLKNSLESINQRMDELEKKASQEP
ncbi:MAG: DUF5320 domain-containing protein [Desulfobacterales bacterium]